MSTRTRAPKGAPCWTDLWTSDVDGSRAFYSAVFGWEAHEPDPQFGGYFMFTKDGQPVAGAMGDMPGMPAQDVWKIYLQTDDIEQCVSAATKLGATTLGPVMPVADMGVQGVMQDPVGAHVGVWQAGTFPGFVTLKEHGHPSWFELQTREFANAVSFYESVFDWQTQLEGDTDQFRYATVKNADVDGDVVAGVMDASAFLAADQTSYWSVYWEVADVAATIAQAVQLGGSVVHEAEDTPYGALGAVADPAGAVFKLRTSNA